MTLVKAATIVPATIACSAVAYVLFDLVAHRKVLGGKTQEEMGTLNGKWREATQLRLLNLEREGAPDEPVLLNPFRNNIPASIKNMSEFPSLEG